MARTRKLLEKNFGEHLVKAIYNLSDGNFEIYYKSQIRDKICDNSNQLWVDTQKIMKSRKQSKKRNNQEKFVKKITDIIYDFQVGTHFRKLNSLYSSITEFENLLKNRISYIEKKNHYLTVYENEKKLKSVAEQLMKEIPRRIYKFLKISVRQLIESPDFNNPTIHINPSLNYYHNMFTSLQGYVCVSTKKYYPHKSFEITANIINIFIGDELSEEWVSPDSIEKNYRRENRKFKELEKSIQEKRALKTLKK